MVAGLDGRPVICVIVRKANKVHMAPNRKKDSKGSAVPQHSNLHDFIQNHAVIIFLGAIVGGFVAGWAANREFLVGGGKQIVPTDARILAPGEKAALASEKTDDDFLYSIFGADRRIAPRADMVLTASENRQKLQEGFQGATNSIQMVIIDGTSWIQEHIKVFDEKAKTVNVELLMLDFGDPAFHEFVQRAMMAAGHRRKEQPHYAEVLEFFEKRINPSSKFSVGVYNWYPWCRFTIFDGKAVSFILTPAIAGGPQAQPFFTTEPGLVECFTNLFNQIRSSSKVFKTAQEASNYRKTFGRTRIATRSNQGG